MNLHFHRLGPDDVSIPALGTVTARTGAFVGAPSALRAGFGEIIATARSADLAEIPAQLFREIDSHDRSSAPFGPCATAFSLSPFERDEPTTAWVFENTVTLDESGAWLASVHQTPAVALRVLAETTAASADGYDVPSSTLSPTPDQYAHLVASAIAAIRRREVDKVVLGRRASGRMTMDIDPAVVVARLHEREPACTLYAVPVDGGRYLGASPELLISVFDDVIAARPLAGTVALAREEDASDYGGWLLGSSKNLYEHRVVVEEIVDALTPFCTEVSADSTPSIVTLRSVAHLGTWIHAKLDTTVRRPAISLLAALHPTPAVGGRPRAVATTLIAQLEGEPRQQFAGAVGWMDAAGNGEWWLAIRGLTVSGPNYTAWAGAGIVADSDPIAEREETRAKLDTILVGLGSLP